MPVPRGLTWVIFMVMPPSQYPGHEPEGSPAPGKSAGGTGCPAVPCTACPALPWQS